MPYQLEIHLPNSAPEIIDIAGPTILGSSEKADLRIEDCDLPLKLCRFRVNQGVLTVMNLSGQTPPLKIKKQNLERGKMYILDDEDVLTFGELEIVIHEVGLNDDEAQSPVVDIPNDIDPSEDNNNDSSHPLFNSTAELLNTEEQEKEDELPEPSSINVSQVLRRAKEESGEVDQPQTKPKPQRNKENEENEESKMQLSEKSSTRLIEFTQKLKSALNLKRLRKGPVKVGSPDIFTQKDSSKRSYKSSAKITLGWPGFVPRFFAFTLEMTVCVLLASPLTQKPEVLNQWQKLVEEVGKVTTQRPQFQVLTELMTFLQAQGFLALTLFAFLQIFIGFLFGRSLGYVFMGINEDSGFITKRVKALLRSLIFILTGPLLLFDLPILIKKRSFKEWLTRSALYRPSSWPGILSSVLLFPPIILAFLISSFASQRKPISIDFLQTQPARVKQRFTFNSLNLRFPIDALEERQSLPDLKELNKPGILLFYRGLDQKPLKLNLGPSYSLENWLKGFLDNNYAFSILNPELYQRIESAFIPGSLSFTQRQDLEQLFKDSLTPVEQGFQTTFRLLKTYGLDLGALNKISENLKKSFSFSDKTVFKWINFLQRDILWLENTTKEHLEVQIIFLDVVPFKSIVITIPILEKDKTLELVERELIQILPILPGPSLKNEEALMETSHRISDQILEFSVNSSLSSEELENLYDSLFHFTGELLGGATNLYRDKYEDQISILLNKLHDEQNLSSETQKFYEKLQRLNLAYLNGESSFFMKQETRPIDNAQNKGDDI
jgi:hypothetical protein